MFAIANKPAEKNVFPRGEKKSTECEVRELITVHRLQHIVCNSVWFKIICLAKIQIQHKKTGIFMKTERFYNNK